jgi:hypothetical protein
MSGSALLHTISFMALVAMIVLTVLVVLMLESIGHPPAREQETAGSVSDGPGDGAVPVS